MLNILTLKRNYFYKLYDILSTSSFKANISAVENLKELSIVS